MKVLGGKTVTSFLSEASLFLLAHSQPLDNIVELFPAHWIQV